MTISLFRSGDELVEITSKWNIGASGAHTKTPGFVGTGFSGVTRTAAGKYTITFSRGTPPGGLVDLYVSHWPAADSNIKTTRPTVNGYTAETPAAQATALYESWSVTGAPAQSDFASGDQVTITAVFQKTK